MSKSNGVSLFGSLKKVVQLGSNLSSNSFPSNSQSNLNLNSISSDGEGHITNVKPDGEFDILLGRGRTSWSQSGNKRFRNFVGLYLKQYMDCDTRSGKTRLVHQIYEDIIAEGAKFWKYDSKREEWFQCGRKVGREKIAHAMRDAIGMRITLGESDQGTKDKLHQLNQQNLKKKEKPKHKHKSKDDPSTKRKTKTKTSPASLPSLKEKNRENTNTITKPSQSDSDQKEQSSTPIPITSPSPPLQPPKKKQGLLLARDSVSPKVVHSLLQSDTTTNITTTTTTTTNATDQSNTTARPNNNEMPPFNLSLVPSTSASQQIVPCGFNSKQPTANDFSLQQPHQHNLHQPLSGESPSSFLSLVNTMMMAEDATDYKNQKQESKAMEPSPQSTTNNQLNIDDEFSIMSLDCSTKKALDDTELSLGLDTATFNSKDNISRKPTVDFARQPRVRHRRQLSFESQEDSRLKAPLAEISDFGSVASESFMTMSWASSLKTERTNITKQSMDISHVSTVSHLTTETEREWRKTLNALKNA